MMDIKDIKTRDRDIINLTLSQCGKSESLSLDDLEGMMIFIERYPFDIHCVRLRSEKSWVVTNVYDDDLYPQDYFRNEDFVIREVDLNLAVGRAIHYTHHKKIKD